MLDFVAEILDTNNKKTRSMSDFDLSVADAQQLQCITSELKLCRHTDRDAAFLEHALSAVPLVMRLPPVLRHVRRRAVWPVRAGPGRRVCSEADEDDDKCLNTLRCRRAAHSPPLCDVLCIVNYSRWLRFRK